MSAGAEATASVTCPLNLVTVTDLEWVLNLRAEAGPNSNRQSVTVTGSCAPVTVTNLHEISHGDGSQPVTMTDPV